MENCRTLIIDITFTPIKIVSWEKGLVYSLTEKALPLEWWEKEIKSVSKSYRIPAVSMLKRKHLALFSRSRWSKANVLLRDNYTCQYCSTVPGKNNLTIDHIVPVSKGGKNEWSNTVACCSSCNTKKGNSTLLNSGFSLIKEPTRPKSYLLNINKNIEIPEIWNKYI